MTTRVRAAVLTAILAATLLSLTAPARAQPYRPEDPRSQADQWADQIRTSYHVDLSRSASQVVTITTTLSDLDQPEVLLRLPTWRPGRYEILDPAGTIRKLTAVDRRGEPVAFEPVDKASWRFRTRGVTELRVTAEIYANSIGDRTRHADDTHAFLSPSSTFFYTDARRDEPLAVTIDAPEGWRVACGLATHPARPGVLVAPDYDTMVDCPLEVGVQDVARFDVRGVPHEIVIWGEHRADMDRLVADFTAIVEHQTRMFEGDRPPPYGRYVFMIHVGPGLGGGTEHVNSTIMQTRPTSFTDDDAYQRFLGLVSHEMYHTWNVKRLRPAGLTPYDYARENYTDLLWVVEGTTSYYDDLTLARTGLITVDEYLDRLGSTIASTRARPGLGVQSLAASSFHAWTKFNKRTPDSGNTTVNFYGQGALASLVIDQWIRRQSGDGRSLDNAMRDLYERHPLEDGGFTGAHLARAIARAAGATERDAAELLAQLAATPGDLPMEDALTRVGLELTPDDPPEGADLGLALASRDGFALVRGVVEGAPAFDAGVIVGDLIVAIDGNRATPSTIEDRMRDTQPGSTVELAYFRNGQLRTRTVPTTAPKPQGWTLQHADEPTPDQRRAYRAWLGLDWPAEG